MEGVSGKVVPGVSATCSRVVSEVGVYGGGGVVGTLAHKALYTRPYVLVVFVRKSTNGVTTLVPLCRECRV